MDLTSISDLKLALQLAGLHAQKNLGQHFLVDRGSLEAVIEAAHVTADDTVLEIGPGLGVMTYPLAERAKRVIAVEADTKLADLLGRDKPQNLEVVTEDFRKYELDDLPAGYKVVANIPYYATSPIIRRLLEANNRPTEMSLLVQKEVAQRIAARPGQMSILALSVQYYGKPTLVQLVEKEKFWPAPKVDSAVLHIQLYDKPAFEADAAKLFRLMKAGFGEKRKQLKNSLAGGLNITIDLATSLIENAKLAPTARAQELSLDDWERLYQLTLAKELI